MVYERRQRFKYGRTDICNDEFIHYIARILHLCISLSLLSDIKSQICLNKSTKCHNRQYNLTDHGMKIYLNNCFKKILQSHEKCVKPKGVYVEKSDRFAFFLFDGTKRRENVK